MLKVKFKKLNSNVKLPVKGSSHAACYDVFAHSITFDNSGNAVISFGFKTEIPDGYKGIIVPRSGFTKHSWLMANSPAQIDSDYRGEWMMKIKPFDKPISESFLPFGVGDRCAQIYFEKVLDVQFEEVDELSDTDRGDGGFGSSGVK
jgi:dUTP pyrophosphatase